MCGQAAARACAPSLLSPVQAAARLGISPTILKRMRLRGEKPPALRLSARVVRYSVGGLQQWLDQRGAGGLAQCSISTSTAWTRRTPQRSRGLRIGRSIAATA